MACKTCGGGLAARMAAMVASVENKINGATPQSFGPVPKQSVSGPDSNVFGDPTSKISSNGTNLSLSTRN